MMRPIDVSLRLEDTFLRAYALKLRNKMLVDRDAIAFSEALVQLAGAVTAEEMGLYGNTPTVMVAKAAGWALAADRPEVTAIEDGVAELVDSVKVEGCPEVAPAFFRGGAVFVRTKTGRPLYGEVLAIVVYRALEAWYATTYEVKDGNRLHCNGYRFQLEWGRPSMEAAVVEAPFMGDWIADDGTKWREADPADRKKLLPSPAEREAILPALRWVLALGALLEARGTPLEHADAGAAERIIRRKRYQTAPGVSYRTVRVSQAGVRAMVPGGPASTSEEPGAPAGEREGLSKRPVRVASFLRRQACGPKMSERRWVYVREHVATRWARDELEAVKTTVVAAPEDRAGVPPADDPAAAHDRAVPAGDPAPDR
jgi:hypothetical protein